MQVAHGAGFNPCCIGLAIAGCCSRIAGNWSAFQSLLYWISHCGPDEVAGTAQKVSVSILVVLD